MIFGSWKRVLNGINFNYWKLFLITKFWIIWIFKANGSLSNPSILRHNNHFNWLNAFVLKLDLIDKNILKNVHQFSFKDFFWLISHLQFLFIKYITAKISRVLTLVIHWWSIFSHSFNFIHHCSLVVRFIESVTDSL